MMKWQLFAKCFTVTILQMRKLRLTQASLFQTKKLRSEDGISTPCLTVNSVSWKTTRGRKCTSRFQFHSNSTDDPQGISRSHVQSSVEREVNGNHTGSGKWRIKKKKKKKCRTHSRLTFLLLRKLELGNCLGSKWSWQMNSFYRITVNTELLWKLYSIVYFNLNYFWYLDLL